MLCFGFVFLDHVDSNQSTCSKSGKERNKKGFRSIKLMLESGKCLVGFMMGEGEDWFGYVCFGVKKWGRGFEGEGLSWI